MERASFATGDRSIDLATDRRGDVEAARRASREIARRAAKSRRSRRGAISASVEKHGRCIGRPLSLYSSRALDQRTNTFTAEPRSDARTHTSSRSTSRPTSQPSDQPSSQSAQQPHNTRAIIRARRVRPRLNALENSAICLLPPDRCDSLGASHSADQRFAENRRNGVRGTRRARTFARCAIFPRSGGLDPAAETSGAEIGFDVGPTRRKRKNEGESGRNGGEKEEKNAAVWLSKRSRVSGLDATQRNRSRAN